VVLCCGEDTTCAVSLNAFADMKICSYLVLKEIALVKLICVAEMVLQQNLIIFNVSLFNDIRPKHQLIQGIQSHRLFAGNHLKPRQCFV